MIILLKKFANILTVLATLLLLVGFAYIIIKNQPISGFVSEIAFCYLAIGVFNYLLFGTATLWHKKSEMK